MPGQKFIQKDPTTLMDTEVAAAQTSAGVGDANKIPALDATGKFDASLMPAGLGLDSTTANAGEILAASDLVYISAAGTVFKSDGTAVAKSAIGFVLAGVALGAPALVYFEGTLTGKSGLTPGAKYFTSDTVPGGVSLPAALAGGAGKIIQYIGTAISATAITIEISEPTIRA